MNGRRCKPAGGVLHPRTIARRAWRMVANDIREELQRNSICRLCNSRALKATRSKKWSKLVRRADGLISLALWLFNHGAWSTTGFMVWRYSASDRRMDRKSDHASVWLEAGPSLSDPRPGQGLWRSLYSKSSIHEHS